VSANRLKQFYPVIFITLVVCVTTSLLAFTDSFAQVEIDTQQDEETMDMLQIVFPEANSYTLENDVYTVYDSGKEEIGYAFLAKRIGFWSLITILVGLEDKETIKGITVISHDETEMRPVGEGEVAGPLDFSYLTQQFVGLKIADCYLDTDGGQIDAITMATRSSEAVVIAVREAALEKIELLN